MDRGPIIAQRPSCGDSAPRAWRARSVIVCRTYSGSDGHARAINTSRSSAVTSGDTAGQEFGALVAQILSGSSRLLGFPEGFEEVSAGDPYPTWVLRRGSGSGDFD